MKKLRAQPPANPQPYHPFASELDRLQALVDRYARLVDTLQAENTLLRLERDKHGRLGELSGELRIAINRLGNLASL